MHYSCQVSSFENVVRFRIHHMPKLRGNVWKKCAFLGCTSAELRHCMVLTLCDAYCRETYSITASVCKSSIDLPYFLSFLPSLSPFISLSSPFSSYLLLSSPLPPAPPLPPLTPPTPPPPPLALGVPAEVWCV